MPDYGDKLTDKALHRVDRKLSSIYKTAHRELEEKLKDFNRKYEQRDKIKRQQLADGKISKQQYADWKAGQIFQRKQWETKIQQVASIMADHNNQAAKIINEGRLNIFAENYNYTTYQMEKVVQGVNFNLYTAEAVARLISEDPELLPEWKIDKEKDYAWNKKKVNNIVSQGIIQGESIEQTTKRLCDNLSAQNENKMRMFARTAMTCAENAGRQKQMHDAATRLGIVVNKRWEAVHDGKTRDCHRQLDGQEVPEDGTFESELGDIEFPGDPSADPANAYNCRCSIFSIYPEYEDYEESKKRYEEMEIDGQSYEEWKIGKKNNGEIL